MYQKTQNLVINIPQNLNMQKMSKIQKKKTIISIQKVKFIELKNIVTYA